MSAHLVKYGTAVDLWTILLTAGSRNAQENPTIASGDVQVSTDGAAFVNLDTLPTVSPASGVQVKVPLSAAELTGKRIMVRFKDTSGNEWEEQTILIETYGHASAAHYDFGSAKFTKVEVTAATGDAVVIQGGTTGNGIQVTGGVLGDGIRLVGGADASGLKMEGTSAAAMIAVGGDSSPGAKFRGSGVGSGVYIEGGTLGHGLDAKGGICGEGDGIHAIGGDDAGSGLHVEAVGTPTGGRGLYAVGKSNAGIEAQGDTNGSGIKATGEGDGAGMLLKGGATGMDLDARDLVVRVPTGFSERSGPTSQNITRTGYAEMGVLFTDSTTAPSDEDFDGQSLIGAKIRNVTTQNANGARTNEQFVILGGYFYADTTDTVSKVFGIALEPLFGITEGGATIVASNWTPGSGNLTEGGNGNGWTFIVAPSDRAYPGSGDTLEIYRIAAMHERSISAATSLTAQEVRDAMKLAPSGGAPAADSVDDKLDDLETQVGDVETQLGTIEGKVDVVDGNVDAVKAKTDNLPADPASETNVDAVQATTDSIEAKVDIIDTNLDAIGVLLTVVDGKVTIVDTNVDSIVAKLPAGQISGFNLTDTIDGVTVRDILEFELARVNGRYKLNEPDPGKITFYKRDNLTPIFIVQVTTTERTRVSP